MKLVIVESPAKIKTLKKYLGPGFDVDASVGHIRDLPTNGMGFDTETLKPEYVISPDKKSVVARLRKKAKAADHVIIATDLDREGEAIAYHLKKILNPASYSRIVFNEITKSALQAALANPGEIDLKQVAAQECRRLLDRYVGYTVSPWLMHHTKQFKMSAGRVQTVALLLLYMRKKDITEFNTETYYVLRTFHDDEGTTWSADLIPKGIIPEDQELQQIKSEAVINDIQTFVMSTGRLTVKEIKKERKKEKPPAPFKTSTLQQAASNALNGFTPQLTMQIAQKLYEGGHITYMRTDVVNLSEEATTAIRNWLTQWGQAKGIQEPVIPAKPNRFSSNADAQEAHEAIRPSDIHNMGKNIEGRNERETAQMIALYKLIWIRAVASQMPHHEYDKTTVTLESDRCPSTGLAYLFKTGARKSMVQGWRMLLKDDDSEEKDENPESDEKPMPRIAEGDVVRVNEAKILDKQTKPPGHYKEATLIKKLEAEGIGRPSTYASLIATLLKRGYAQTNKKKQFIITDHGVKAIESLNGRFSFVDVQYTRKIESQLDDIASGRSRYKDVLMTQIKTLNSEIESNGGMPPAREPKAPAKIIKECPSCSSGGLVVRNGTRGDFLACNRYPKCKHSEDLITDGT